MRQDVFEEIERYMLSCMTDAAHDPQHIYRVLYHSLDIAQDYPVDVVVLIAAALLHDIGRDAQYSDPEADHAAVGAAMAYRFLKDLGWSAAMAGHVQECIASHRFRGDARPSTWEARILFDADKLDVAGAMGIARTLAYQGIVAVPLYQVGDDGTVLDGLDAPGAGETEHTFFGEYEYKLKGLYGIFHTDRAASIAGARRQAAVDFYESLRREGAPPTRRV